MRGPKEISAMLASRAESVTAMLLPGGHRNNGHWECGDISGQPGKTLKVNLSGPHVGKWRDWADPDTFKGDLLDLWAVTKGVQPSVALKEAKMYLGVEDLVQSAEVSYRPARDDHNEPHDKLYEYFLSRKINPEIVNRFRIQWSTEKFTDFKEPQNCIVFPCYDANGERVNNSYCATKRTEKGKKAVKQDPGARPCLFGWQGLSESVYARKSLILCEGQIDCMSWTQWGFDCLSIPSGASTKWIEAEWEHLEVFETILLSFDMDGKTSAAQQETITRLGKHRCKIISLPHKDANECLKQGCSAEDAKKWVDEAKEVPIPGLIKASDMRQRILDEFFPPEDSPKIVRCILLNGDDNDHSFKIRPAEVTAWTGISSHGKTAFLVSIFTEMLIRENCFIASMEMKPERIFRNIVRSSTGRECAPGNLIHEAISAVGSRLCFCDKIGYISQKDLLEMMMYAYRRYGSTQFMIDSMMRIEGLEEDYPAQGMFLNRLQEFSKETDTHVHLVVHPRKIMKDERPTADDLKGSSLIRNNVDNVLCVFRNAKKERDLADGKINQQEHDSQWDTEVTVEKDREEGLFKMFRYKFNRKLNQHKRITVLR